MKLKIVSLAAAALMASMFSISASAGTLDGLQVMGGLSASSAGDSVSSASSDSSGKTLTIGLGYSMPVADDQFSMGVVGEAVVSFGTASTHSIGVSFQPGYYVTDDVVVYGKVGVVSEARSADTLSGVTMGLGVKYKIAPNTFIAGEIEQIKFTVPANSTSGIAYNLKDTRMTAKIGYVF